MIKIALRSATFTPARALRVALGGSALMMALAGGSVIALAQTAPVAAAPAHAAEAPSKIPVLTRAQLDALLATPDKVVFIDVRRPDEVSEIGGFPFYLSIQISELDRFVAAIPKDRQVVVVSNHAGRGQKGAEILAAKGVNVVGAAGVQNYEQEGGILWNKKFVTPEIPGVTKGGALISVVREGFQGTEGPVVLKDGSILFTENRADRLVKIAANGDISTYLDKDGGANALAVAANGELFGLLTTAGSTGVVQYEPVKKVITSGPKGAGFVRPNDFARSSKGDLYVSDPGAYQKATQGGAVPTGPIKTGFYWVNPKGKVVLVADDITFPNGVALSADEKTVYVANTAGEAVIAFTVNPDGSLKDRRDFAKLVGIKNGRSGADGIAVDKDGRVFVTSNAGVEVFDAAGKALGVIAFPRKIQNIAFGGPDHARLYAVGSGSVYRVPTLTAGPARLGK
jgi:gluconolactonase